MHLSRSRLLRFAHIVLGHDIRHVQKISGFLGIVVLTRIRQPAATVHPWGNHDDPVEQCSLSTQERMWASPGINVTLRWLHLDAGLATIALLATWPRAVALDGAGVLALGLGRLRWPGHRRQPCPGRPRSGRRRDRRHLLAVIDQHSRVVHRQLAVDDRRLSGW